MLKAGKFLVKKAVKFYINRKFNSDSLQMLFIIGHMRSGSSLLVHILNTNTQIIGYGETHSIYKDKRDFEKAAYKIYRAFNTIPKNEKFVLDKILHSYLIKDSNLLKEAKIIFLIRKPEETLPSIHKLDPQKYPPSSAFEYYKDRIKKIKTLASNIESSKWTYLTYNDLINRQNIIFERLENFLELNTKLSGQYKTIWSTGKKGIGDSSKKIQSGKIITQKQKTNVDKSLKPYLKIAQKEYLECMKALEGNN